MITLTYEHDCPKDYDLYLCPVEGQQVVIRPEVQGTAYLLPEVRCVHTTAVLKLVKVER